MLKQTLLFTGCLSIQNTFSKLLRKRESSEELPKSSIICLTTFLSIYFYYFKNLWMIVFIFLKSRIRANYY